MAKKIPLTPTCAKEVVSEVFSELSRCESISAVEELYDTHPAICGYKMEVQKYPKLEFSITADEIEQLRERGILNEGDLSLKHDHITENTDPLIKLLYAQTWKNGDIGKLQHIARGIAEAGTDQAPESALVFYQFGAHLNDRDREPIVDQHVLRAYAIKRASDEKDITKWRKLGQLRQSHQELIDDYRDWLLTSGEITAALRRQEGYLYVIDQLLFATGKAIK